METFSALLPFMRGIHQSPVNSPHGGQWRGTLRFYLICAGTNGWVNNRGAFDLIRHRAYYDVTVMRIAVRQTRSKLVPGEAWRRIYRFVVKIRWTLSKVAPILNKECFPRLLGNWFYIQDMPAIKKYSGMRMKKNMPNNLAKCMNTRSAFRYRYP